MNAGRRRPEASSIIGTINDAVSRTQRQTALHQPANPEDGERIAMLLQGR